MELFQKVIRFVRGIHPLGRMQTQAECTQIRVASPNVRDKNVGASGVKSQQMVRRKFARLIS